MKNPLSSKPRLARLLTSGTCGNRDFAFQAGAVYALQDRVPELEVFIDGVRGVWLDEVPPGARALPMSRAIVHRDDAPAPAPYSGGYVTAAEIQRRFRWDDAQLARARALNFPGSVGTRGRRTGMSDQEAGPQEQIWVANEVDRWAALAAELGVIRESVTR